MTYARSHSTTNDGGPPGHKAQAAHFPCLLRLEMKRGISETSTSTNRDRTARANTSLADHAVSGPALHKSMLRTSARHRRAQWSSRSPPNNCCYATPTHITLSPLSAECCDARLMATAARKWLKSLTEHYPVPGAATMVPRISARMRLKFQLPRVPDHHHLGPSQDEAAHDSHTRARRPRTL